MKRKRNSPKKEQVIKVTHSFSIKQTIEKLFPIFLGIFISCILILSLRGIAGNPNSQDLNNSLWKDNGPLELSPERGRFALLYSFIVDHSLSFSTPIARFSSPDVAYLNGSYVSLFAPGVSFIVIPGFLLGQLFGISQVGAFAVIAIFAVINTFLIRRICMLLGMREVVATLCALIFLFGTPAFAYGVTLYQHHISTFLLLCSLYLLIRYKAIWSLAIIWMLCSASIIIDYPNLFILFPIGMYALFQMVSLQEVRNRVQVAINMPKALTLLTLGIPMLFFFWFNTVSYHNPFQLAGTIERALEVNPDGSPVLERQKLAELSKDSPQQLAILATQSKSAVAFFKTRNLLNGFYEHFLSEDRGMIFFTPVMLLGFIGMILALKNNFSLAPLVTAVIAVTVILYSLWGDPYGGWAFGSRYLIPSYAMLSIFIAYLIEKWQKSRIFLFLVLALTLYSVSVNTIGALTSNRNPPKVEVLGLEKESHHEEKYTYMRNVGMLDQNISKSFVFQTFVKHSYTAWEYFFFVDGILSMGLLGGFIYLFMTRKESYV